MYGWSAEIWLDSVLMHELSSRIICVIVTNGSQ